MNEGKNIQMPISLVETDGKRNEGHGLLKKKKNLDRQNRYHHLKNN